MISIKLKDLEIELPPAPKPVASYTPALVNENLIYVSGQLPIRKGELIMTGQMTPTRKIEEAQKAMELCLINGLSAATLVVPLDSITGVLRIAAYVSSAVDFTQQHIVANGASDLALKIFGTEGMHVRSAVGVAVLPLNSTVELEIVFKTSQPYSY